MRFYTGRAVSRACLRDADGQGATAIVASQLEMGRRREVTIGQLRFGMIAEVSGWGV